MRGHVRMSGIWRGAAPWEMTVAWETVIPVPSHHRGAFASTLPEEVASSLTVVDLRLADAAPFALD